MDAVESLAQAVGDLDSMIAKGAPPGEMALAALECEFYGKELLELSERLKSRARGEGLREVV